jgi:hypothetical protein
MNVGETKYMKDILEKSDSKNPERVLILKNMKGAVLPMQKRKCGLLGPCHFSVGPSFPEQVLHLLDFGNQRQEID